MQPIINAPIKFVNTMQEAMYYSTVSKIIYIGEDPNIPEFFIRIPALLPPTEAAYAEMNNDVNNYMYIYENYLNNFPDVKEYLCQILILLHHGNPVTIYIQDGNDLLIGQFLPTWFYKVAGLYNYETVQGVDQYGMSYYPYNDQTPQFINQVAILLYTYGNGIISGEYFILSVDDLFINNIQSNPEVLNRLDKDFNLFNLDINEKIQFLLNWKYKFNRFYINPMNNLADGQSPFEYVEEDNNK